MNSLFLPLTPPRPGFLPELTSASAEITLPKRQKEFSTFQINKPEMFSLFFKH